MARPFEPRSVAESLEGIRNDYDAVKATRYRRRRTGMQSGGSSADYHYRSESDYLRLMEEARDFDRNDLVVGAIVDRAVDCTLQDVIAVDPQTGDKTLDDELAARWKEWSETPDLCDVQGERTFAELARMAFRHTLVDGDCVPLLVQEDGQVQLIEGHLIRTPAGKPSGVVHGVEVNERRRRLKYHILQEDVDPSGRILKRHAFKPFDVRDENGRRQVCHVYNPKRISQTRGVSAFAPVFDELGNFDDLFFAKLVQSQVVSCFAIFRERTGVAPPTGAAGSYGPASPRAPGDMRKIEGVSPGMEVTGEEGEKLHGFSPNTPNPEFFPHARLILQLVSLNLGLPLIIALLDASETNFTGWRGAVDQARVGFRRNQRAVLTQFHEPVWRWKVNEWIEADYAVSEAKRRDSKINLFKHKWNPPGYPYIQPLQDASTDLLMVRNGLTSPRRLHASKGRDWFEIADETVEDNAYAIRVAKKQAALLNKEFPGDPPVHWRELLSLPTPDGLSVKLLADPANEQAEAAPKKPEPSKGQS